MLGAESGKGLQTGWVPDTIPSDRQKNIFFVSPTKRATGWARIVAITNNGAAQVRNAKTHIRNTSNSPARGCAKDSHWRGFKFTGLQDQDTELTAQNSTTDLLEPPAQMSPSSLLARKMVTIFPMSQLSTMCTWKFLLSLWYNDRRGPSFLVLQPLGRVHS